MGTDGVAIDTSNSAGADNDAYVLVTGNPKFSNVQAVHGGLSVQVTELSSASTQTVVLGGLGNLVENVWARAYFYMDAYPAQIVRLMQFNVTQTTTMVAGIRMNASGVLQGVNAAATAIGGATSAIPLSQWFRVEARCFPSTTIGELEWYVYLTADSTTPDYSFITGNQVFSASIDAVRYGIAATPSAFGTTWIEYVDDLAAGNTGWFGPSGVPGTIYTDSGTVGIVITPSSTDTADLVDADTPVVGITPSSADTVQFVDAATVGLAITPSAADTAQFADASTASVAITPSAADTAQFVDANTAGVAIMPSSSDTSQYVDSNTPVVGIVPSAADTAQFVDAATTPVAITPSAVDIGIIHTDAATTPVTITPSASDTAQYVDSATSKVVITPSASDTAQFVDSSTAAVAIIPSASDTAQFVDSLTATVAITPSSADIAQYTEALTARLSVTPSASESAQYVDSATSTVKMTPSTADIAQFVDSNTATVALSPSASETSQFVDSNTPVVVITPSGIELVGGSFLANNLEGGTNGTTISNANSGGASGDAFTITQGTSKYDTAQAAHGTFSAKITLASGTASANNLGWSSIGAVTTETYGRFYFRKDANPTQLIRLLGLVSSGATLGAALRLNTSGQLQIQNAALVLQGTASPALPSNQWVRIEYRYLPGTSGGELEVRVWFNADNALTPDWTSNITGAALGADLDTVRMGIASTPSILTATWNIWLDDVEARATSWIGPVTPVYDYTDAQTVTLAITPSGSDVLVPPTIDTGTVIVKLTPSKTEIYETAVTVAITPSSVDVVQRLYTDGDEIMYLNLSPSVTEGFGWEDPTTVPLTLTPRTLFEQLGDGDIVPVSIKASTVDVATFADDATRLDLTITVTGLETDLSLSTFGEVDLAITPDVLTEIIAAQDAATVALLITPGIIEEAKLIADFLLVGVLSNLYAALLRDNSYVSTMQDVQYVASGIENTWSFIWHGRGDE